jgi:predicted pyridoxine 5'-phosphate oxidase superfamily flavin-nucleotide-binding protein
MYSRAMSASVPPDGDACCPGSDGEHELQERWDAVDRARTFYDKQVLDFLNPEMTEFIGRQELVFVSTSDGRGECDCSFRAGEPGFVTVLDPRTLVYPELRGNGVYASMGNISENPNIGLLFVDFFRDIVGLHVNGAASIVDHEDMLADERTPLRILEDLQSRRGRRPERWVQVHVHEAYIHCSKHIPMLARLDKRVDWGTDDVRRKGGDFFNIAGTKGAADPSRGGIRS